MHWPLAWVTFNITIMSEKLDIQQWKIALTGVGKYPKDIELEDNAAVYDRIKDLAGVLTNPQIVGIDKNHLEQLIDTPDNTSLKEKLALIAENATDLLVFYYSGQMVFRKGKLYLTTADSTLLQAYINGVALDELMLILRESRASARLVILDAPIARVGEGVGSDLEKEVHACLESYLHADERLSLLASPVTASGHTFMEGLKYPNLTGLLTALLRDGIKEQHLTIHLADVHHLLTQSYKASGFQSQPLLFSRNPQQVHIAYNKRFITFSELKKQADRMFEEGLFEEAKPHFEEALHLFELHQEVKDKLAFIHLFQKGKVAMNAGQYQGAREAFEEAYQLLPLSKARAMAIEATEKLADEFFQQKRFDAARKTYEELNHLAPNETFYLQRLTACQQELDFADLVDEADNAYFNTEYALALELYEKALAINQNKLIIRRREECSKFLERELQIRAKIYDEIKAELSTQQTAPAEPVAVQVPVISEEELEQIRQEAYSEARKAARLEARLELREEVWQQAKEEARAEVTEELENTVWATVGFWNEMGAYELYLQVFPEGRFTAPARQRIEELRARQVVAPVETLVFEESVPDSAAAKERIRLSQVVQLEKIGQVDYLAPDEASDPVSDLSSFFKEEKPRPEEQTKFEVSYNETANGAAAHKDVVQEEEVEDEEVLWERAQKVHSVEAYLSYVHTTHEGKYVPDAYYMINKLNRLQEQEEATEAAERVPDSSSTETQETSYRSFSTDYGFDAGQNQQEDLQTTTSSDSENLYEATTPQEITHADDTYKSTADDDDEDILWNDAKNADTISSYFVYLNNTTERRYWDRAKQRVSELKRLAEEKEQTDWTETQDQDTIEAYKEYIRRYPLGNYYAKAMFRLNKLESELNGQM